MTGGFDHDDETLAVQNLRVFEAEFGEDTVFPFSTDEPGVGGVAADMGLTEGTTIELNVSAGLGVWNGSGFFGVGSGIGLSRKARGFTSNATAFP